MTIPDLPELISLGMVQGQTYTLKVSWTDGLDPSSPLSMAGRYAHMQVRTKVGQTGAPVIDSYSGYITKGANSDAPDDSRLVTAGEADITQEPSGQTGVLQIRLPATATQALSKKSTADAPAYWFDLYTINKTDPTDAVQLVTGIVAVRNSVTVVQLVEPT